MARGGARNRSGPQPDPNSERSEQRKYVLNALPAEGFPGPIPDFPIPDDGEDPILRMRELMLWEDAWSTPQACAWSMEPWRHRIVAQYCRISAVVELSPAATAALIGQLHRFRDQIGLTPAGLKENGWKIADKPVKLGVASADESEDKPAQRRRSRELSA